LTKASSRKGFHHFWLDQVGLGWIHPDSPGGDLPQRGKLFNRKERREHKGVLRVRLLLFAASLRFGETFFILDSLGLGWIRSLSDLATLTSLKFKKDHQKCFG
jgi:hypothetical protein